MRGGEAGGHGAGDLRRAEAHAARRRGLRPPARSPPSTATAPTLPRQGQPEALRWSPTAASLCWARQRSSATFVGIIGSVRRRANPPPGA
jgi:hypothetical protein